MSAPICPTCRHRHWPATPCQVFEVKQKTPEDLAADRAEEIAIRIHDAGRPKKG